VPEAAFVSSAGQPSSLRAFADTIAFELERQAVDPTHHVGGFPEVRADRVYVLVDPPTYLALEGEGSLPDDTALRRTVLLWTSPPPPADDVDEVRLLRRAGSVFVPDQRAVVAMHRLGIPARLIRPGYSSSLDRFDAAAERPIDILVLGVRTERRMDLLERSRQVLARHTSVIELADASSLADDSLPRRSWELLSSAKVVMNIHAGEDDRLEWREVLDAIHAGAAVVSEHASGIVPLDPGVHLLVASGDALPYVAERLVRDGKRREHQRKAAYERLRDWIPFALPVSVLRAALVELVGEPTPPGAWPNSSPDTGRTPTRSAAG
jgi:hypothetical protein